MKTRYRSKKDKSFGFFLIISSLIIISAAFLLPFLINGNASDIIIKIIFTLPFVGLFVWIWFDTCYIIENDILIAKTGPLRLKIRIKEISQIKLNQRTFIGIWKPALSWKGIEIENKKFGSVFINPINQDEFLKKLIQINQKIQIKDT